MVLIYQMTINELKVVALVLEDIVVVHQRHIHLAVDRMVEEMDMVRIWDYHLHQLVCSILHLVSIVLFDRNSFRFLLLFSLVRKYLFYLFFVIFMQPVPLHL